MSSFHERQKALFNELKEAEDQISFSKSNKASAEVIDNAVDRRTYKKLKHEMKQFRGRESIYKRKEANIRECLRARTIPDHIKNPQKWKYYSLSDVTPDQMSDSTNTATALALIQKLEEQEEKNKMETEFDDTGVFKKPTFQVSKMIKKEETSDEKVVFKSNKVIMPEYVVGKSKKKNKPVKKIPEGIMEDEKKAELKLNHLYDDDEDD